MCCGQSAALCITRITPLSCTGCLLYVKIKWCYLLLHMFCLQHPIFVNIIYFCSCTKHFERIPYYFKSTETKKQRGIFMMMTCTSVFIIFFTIIDISCIFSVYFAHFVDIVLVRWSQSMVPSRGGWLLPRCVNLWCRAWPSDWWVPVGHIPQYCAARQEVWQYTDRLLPGILPHGEEGLSQVQDRRRG